MSEQQTAPFETDHSVAVSPHRSLIFFSLIFCGIACFTFIGLVVGLAIYYVDPGGPSYVSDAVLIIEETQGSNDILGESHLPLEEMPKHESLIVSVDHIRRTFIEHDLLELDVFAGMSEGEAVAFAREQLLAIRIPGEDEYSLFFYCGNQQDGKVVLHGLIREYQTLLDQMFNERERVFQNLEEAEIEFERALMRAQSELSIAELQQTELEDEEDERTLLAAKEWAKDKRKEVADLRQKLEMVVEEKNRQFTLSDFERVTVHVTMVKEPTDGKRVRTSLPKALGLGGLIGALSGTALCGLLGWVGWRRNSV